LIDFAYAETATPTQDSTTGFLDLMRSYAEDRVVFLSPKRDARYVVETVSESGCSIQRLDSDKAEAVTLSGFEAKLLWLRGQGGSASRTELDATVARHMAYLQSAQMALDADRASAVLLDDSAKATRQFIELIRGMQTTTIYKPVLRL
jgi:hypothetical protein